MRIKLVYSISRRILMTIIIILSILGIIGYWYLTYGFIIFITIGTLAFFIIVTLLSIYIGIVITRLLISSIIYAIGDW